MKKRNFTLWFMLYGLIAPWGATAQLELRMEPPHWWVGMQESGVQVMLTGENIGGSQVKILSIGSGVEILSIESAESPDYLFVELGISSDAPPGILYLALTRPDGEEKLFSYKLKARKPGSPARVGFENQDIIYLITPDRFANGDPANDEIGNMMEGRNRADPNGRHGGDLAGVIQHLDYLNDLGVTSLWLNPVFENNQPNWSYHGYGITDFYRIDPRLGSMDDYLQLSNELQKRDMGLIMDMVVNHCGSEHPWVKDPPFPDWFNYQEQALENSPVITNHMRVTLQDPYRIPSDLDRFSGGWFVREMPDLNQKNPFLARYLIQHSIWWVEQAGLNGIRMDTYSYPDQEFIHQWACSVMREYPGFSIVGEEWHMDPIVLRHWQRDLKHPDPKVCLPSLMDFPLQDALIQSLTQAGNPWSSPWLPLYERLASDHIYRDPGALVTLADNHDMSRVHTQLGHDAGLTSLAMAFILTTRGIPQVFYGTEILMKHPGVDDHGTIRSDFPGGWEGDKRNAFTGEGLASEERDFQEFSKKIMRWRKDCLAIHGGELKHFAPQKDTYIYFRILSDEIVLVALNRGDKEDRIAVERLREVLGDRTEAFDVLDEKMVRLGEQLVVPARSPVILHFKS